MCLVCCGLQCALKLLLSPLMLLGVAITGVGIWLKVDPDFWTLQFNLDAKQFTTGAYVAIAIGIIILIIGFVGCCGASRESLCLLITFFIIMLVLVVLEIAAMAIVWSAVNDKEFSEKIHEKIKHAIDLRESDSELNYFMSIVQKKFQCCGVKGPDDYPIPPNSCKNSETSLYFEQGCLELLVQYLKSKATILGSISIITLLLQICVMVFTMCLICGIRQAGKPVF